MVDVSSMLQGRSSALSSFQKWGPLYEQYNSSGILQEKRLLQITFVLLRQEEFETLATSVGFKVIALYGDYSYAPFEGETSPYMIWILEK